MEYKTDDPTKESYLIFNWARDFMQQEYGIKGFCSVILFRSFFNKYWKNYYNYKGTATHIINVFKKDGYITVDGDKIIWMMDIQDKYKIIKIVK